MTQTPVDFVTGGLKQAPTNTNQQSDKLNFGVHSTQKALPFPAGLSTFRRFL
jgi:hypothetical protein